MSTVQKIQVPIPFPLKTANCYYIEDSLPTLVDAGVNTFEGFETVRSALEKNGGRLENIRRIILTHVHSDHIGLVERIGSMSRAEVFVHRLDRYRIFRGSEAELSQKADALRRAFLEAGVPLSAGESILKIVIERIRRFFCPFAEEKLLQGDEVFAFDDFKLEVIHTAGHTPGSICLFDRKNETLFSGDTLLERITSNPVLEIDNPTDGEAYNSLVSYSQSLDVLRALPVQTVLPGHGASFSNHAKRVEELREHQYERSSEVLQILYKHKNKSQRLARVTQFMVAQELFPGVSGMEVFLALSEARAHLELLESEGKVTSLNESNVKKYQLQE